MYYFKKSTPATTYQYKYEEIPIIIPKLVKLIYYIFLIHYLIYCYTLDTKTKVSSINVNEKNVINIVGGCLLNNLGDQISNNEEGQSLKQQHI